MGNQTAPIQLEPASQCLTEQRYEPISLTPMRRQRDGEMDDQIGARKEVRAETELLIFIRRSKLLFPTDRDSITLFAPLPIRLDFVRINCHATSFAPLRLDGATIRGRRTRAPDTRWSHLWLRLGGRNRSSHANNLIKLPAETWKAE